MRVHTAQIAHAVRIAHTVRRGFSSLTNRRGLAAVTAAAALASGCAGFVSAPVVPPPAVVYTNYKAPLDVDADETNFGTKRGMAEIVNILGVVSFGDGSIAAAAARGNVSVVRHVDYELFNILGVYSRYRTVVYGD